MNKQPMSKQTADKERIKQIEDMFKQIGLGNVDERRHYTFEYFTYGAGNMMLQTNEQMFIHIKSNTLAKMEGENG